MVCVFIVDIVADADELLSAVGAGDEDHRHSHSVALGDQPCFRGVSLSGWMGTHRKQEGDQSKERHRHQKRQKANIEIFLLSLGHVYGFEG